MIVGQVEEEAARAAGIEDGRNAALDLARFGLDISMAVAISSSTFWARMTPCFSNSASYAASLPVMAPEWLLARCALVSVRPTLMATIGTSFALARSSAEMKPEGIAHRLQDERDHLRLGPVEHVVHVVGGGDAKLLAGRDDEAVGL